MGFLDWNDRSTTPGDPDARAENPGGMIGSPVVEASIAVSRSHESKKLPLHPGLVNVIIPVLLVDVCSFFGEVFSSEEGFCEELRGSVGGRASATTAGLLIFVIVSHGFFSLW